MPGINLRPRTLTSPETIPQAGASVTFTVEARATGVSSSPARFTFLLRAADGYRWDNGSTSITRTGTVTQAFTALDFALRLRQQAQTGAALLLVTVEGVLLAGGQPASTVKRSSARLTVGGPLAGVLSAHRQSEGLTQAALAQRIGVSPSWVSDLEHGANPSFEVFAKIKETMES